MEQVCRILSLDGGGSKGFYTLGVLREVEAMLPRPINETFDLIFGTSTGSIIAACLSLGRSVDEVYEAYRRYVPRIMGAAGAGARTVALRVAGEDIFGDAGFDQAKTPLGIVATRWRQETPMVFKSSEGQVQGHRADFEPGFGCSIAEAVEASCAAYPFFKRKMVTTAAGEKVELFDGGYCANNPTLYALAEATTVLGHAPEHCRVLSIGCGQYAPPQTGYIRLLLKGVVFPSLAEKMANANAASMEQLRRLLFATAPTVRISDTTATPGLATDMFEHDLVKLDLLRQHGGRSFAAREQEIRELLLAKEES